VRQDLAIAPPSSTTCGANAATSAATRWRAGGVAGAVVGDGELAHLLAAARRVGASAR
jgi:hypothetical protein